MSRAPPPGGFGRIPFTAGMPGNNYRVPPGQGRPPPPGGPYGGNPGTTNFRQDAGPPRYQQGLSSAPDAGKRVSLRVQKVAEEGLRTRLVFQNICAVSQNDFPRELQNPKRPDDGSAPFYVLLRCENPTREFVVMAQSFHQYSAGCISLTDPQRTWCQIGFMDAFTGEVYDPFASGNNVHLGSIDVEIGFALPEKKTTDIPYDEEDLAAEFQKVYRDQILAPGQRMIMEHRGIPLYITVKTVELFDLLTSSEDTVRQTSRESHARGILIEQTRVVFHRDGSRDGHGKFKLKPSLTKPNSNPIFTPGFKFEDMGIGGLSKEFSTIFRGAFASRVFPPGLVANMGIQHVKGLLLYGPPGTGKTLIARQIGKMLNARPPKIINGPEVLNKYVGQSEENIRNLFADAEKEYKEKGDESGLHIIIFDELDAVCKQRGSGAGGGTGVGDSVVNQLLSKLDGVDQLNNILLIGMTNRKDMIDDALMRPGRLEIHVEVSLPDEPGRLEIFKIHTAKMRKANILDPDVNLEELASLTKNYSGAEISGVVKAATSFCFERYTEVGSMAAPKHDLSGMMVNRKDFLQALTQVRPHYGVPEEEIERDIELGIISYSKDLDSSIEDVTSTIIAVREYDLCLASILFHGPPGAGKTALAAHLALRSDFPFVKMITPGDLRNCRDEFAKADYVLKVLADAYKSPASIIVLDENHRLLVLATTSKLPVMQMLEFDDAFDEQVVVPGICNVFELASILEGSGTFDAGEIDQVTNEIQQRLGSENFRIGIKRIAYLISRAKTGSDSNFRALFLDFLIKDLTKSRGGGNIY
ncbi:hypothetical protein E4U43_002674 [Claviceps pusilla]|uniref:Vesicular-fusion protein SEC18 n=1 Tax=Claviceps pusilla TaxID=123648 RepID=A0A9P7SYC1_9HYPO|nr:hypothetical protein E4U43_002674 [Claviceps pusilla]